MNPVKQKSIVSEAVRKYEEFLFPAVVACVLFFSICVPAQTTALRFEATIARGVVSAPQKGRLFIFLNRKAEPEPRFADDDVSLDAPLMLAKDAESFAVGET